MKNFLTSILAKIVSMNIDRAMIHEMIDACCDVYEKHQNPTSEISVPVMEEKEEVFPTSSVKETTLVDEPIINESVDDANEKSETEDFVPNEEAAAPEKVKESFDLDNIDYSQYCEKTRHVLDKIKEVLQNGPATSNKLIRMVNADRLYLVKAEKIGLIERVKCVLHDGHGKPIVYKLKGFDISQYPKCYIDIIREYQLDETTSMRLAYTVENLIKENGWYTSNFVSKVLIKSGLAFSILETDKLLMLVKALYSYNFIYHKPKRIEASKYYLEAACLVYIGLPLDYACNLVGCGYKICVANHSIDRVNMDLITDEKIREVYEKYQESINYYIEHNKNGYKIQKPEKPKTTDLIAKSTEEPVKYECKAKQEVSSNDDEVTISDEELQVFESVDEENPFVKDKNIGSDGSNILYKEHRGRKFTIRKLTKDDVLRFVETYDNLVKAELRKIKKNQKFGVDIVKRTAVACGYQNMCIRTARIILFGHKELGFSDVKDPECGFIWERASSLQEDIRKPVRFIKWLHLQFDWLTYDQIAARAGKSLDEVRDILLCVKYYEIEGREFRDDHFTEECEDLIEARRIRYALNHAPAFGPNDIK